MKRLRQNYAGIVATLALVVSLTATGAYATGQLGPKSVGERQLRPGAVTAEKIRRSAVTAPKIKALAVKQGKLANGSVTGAKLTPGAVATSSLAEAAVSGPKLADGSVTGEKVQEATLSQVPSAARAEFAVAAESANPLAFAAVDAEGNTNPTLTKNVAAVRKAAGVYCLTTDFIPRGAQVTLRNVDDGGASAFATVGGTEACPAPAVEVRTFDGGLAAEPFYAVLYR